MAPKRGTLKVKPAEVPTGPDSGAPAAFAAALASAEDGMRRMSVSPTARPPAPPAQPSDAERIAALLAEVAALKAQAAVRLSAHEVELLTQAEGMIKNVPSAINEQHQVYVAMGDNHRANVDLWLNMLRIHLE
jgi:hypothetical protein